MKKLALMLAVTCTLAATQSFAHDKTKGKTPSKQEKCSGKGACCKNMKKASLVTKSKVVATKKA